MQGCRPGDILRRLLTTALLAVGTVLPGCLAVPSANGPSDSFGIDFRLPRPGETQAALVFVVDGVRADVFEQMLQAGELPAIRKFLVDRGLYAPRAVSSIPSVTVASLTGIATGLFPGHHGVPGSRVFDRVQLLSRDYITIAQKDTLDSDCRAKTLFEHFPDRTTFSVFHQPRRGATKFIENWMSAGPPYFFGWCEFVDRLTLFRFHLIADVARTQGRFPAVTVAYLISPDFRGHKHGLRGAEYRQALRHTDRQIGRVLGDLASAGLLENLVVALTSDHGHCQVDRTFPLERFLRRRVGLNLAREHLWESTAFENRMDYYRRYSAVIRGSGGRYAAVWLRKPLRGPGGEVSGYEPWAMRPSMDDLRDYPVRKPRRGWWPFRGRPPAPGRANLLELLTSQEPVDAVAYRAGPNRVRVRRKTGEVEFRQSGGRGAEISYHLTSGDDPLGWNGTVSPALLAGRPAAPRAWLAETLRTQFPDLPAQILAYFRSNRAGDLTIFAAPGWDLGDGKRGGHGGLRGRQDLLVPLLLAGPGVPQGHRINAARTIDLMPTLLGLLNKPIPPHLDGISLVDASAQRHPVSGAERPSR